MNLGPQMAKNRVIHISADTYFADSQLTLGPDPPTGISSHMDDPLGWSTEKVLIFNIMDHMGTPSKIKILKIGFRHVLSWPKLVLEPKFHDPGTLGGFGKREQTRFMFYKYRWMNTVCVSTFSSATKVPDS